MNGSSESDQQRSDDCIELNSRSFLDGSPHDNSVNLSSNPTFGQDNRVMCARYKPSPDYGFLPTRRGREKTLWPRINAYNSQVENEDVAQTFTGKDVSLRQWLDNPRRSVDALECMHIYSQIVNIVNTAHSQGNVFQGVCPSCFVLSPNNQVTFQESASCLDLDSSKFRSNSQTSEIKDFSLPSDSLSHPNSESLTGSQGSQMVRNPVDVNSRLKSETSCLQSFSGQDMHYLEASNNEQTGNENHSFHTRQMLVTESSWYTSPEEFLGGPISYASNIYQLGVFLFELFCTFESLEVKSATMGSLRDRVLPPQLLLKWPKEASFCLWLLHPDPSSRPMISELLQSEFLNPPTDDREGQEPMIELSEKIEEHELLLEFLLLLQQRKHDAADSLKETISCVSSDIEEVRKLRTALKVKDKGDSAIELEKYTSSVPDSMNPVNDFESSGSRKRMRKEHYSNSDDSCYCEFEHQKLEAPEGHQGSLLSKNSRLVKHFKKLESAYLLTRRRSVKSTYLPLAEHPPIGVGESVVNERSQVSNPSYVDLHTDNKRSGWINGFLEGLCKYLSFSKLKVKASMKQGDLLSSSNLVCSISFDRDGEFFATAGVNKKIKVFEYCSILNGGRDIHYPVVEMTSGSKLSSICWNSYIKSQIASSNFEGVVQVWDAARSQVFMEMKEHERRVWSIDFSTADPTMLASGSDDGSLKLWNINQGASVGTIKTKANICCVQFPSNSGRSIAFGSADHRIYYYDLRNTKLPLCTLVGHNKTVSYVKFIDSKTLVSASTDNTLKLWDFSMCTSRVLDTPLHSFTGHLNIKNFVGLSVSDGFIATGSETNEVFVYHKTFPMPALSFKFNSADPRSGDEADDATQFISSVCWHEQSSTLVAANSLGHIKILEMA